MGDIEPGKRGRQQIRMSVSRSISYLLKGSGARGRQLRNRWAQERAQDVVAGVHADATDPAEDDP